MLRSQTPRFHSNTLAGCTTMCNPTFSSTTNRITSTGYSFDNAGNTTADPASRTFAYDAENKQTSVSASGSTVGQYSYDGDGKRIKKVVPGTGETTIFVYDAGGKSIAEYSTVVASSTDAKVNYLTSDHLGSPRIDTDANGAVAARHDYMPFGEEISTSQRTGGVGYAGDSVRKQFTGYERDGETGLDAAGARMFIDIIGRFSTPDPLLTSGRPVVPQSWNRFAYTLNNPTNYVDPTGLWEWSDALGGAAKTKDLEKLRAKAKKDGDQAEYDRLNGIVTSRGEFIDALATAKTAAANISDSTERKQVQADLRLYGKEQDGNNVTVAVADPKSGGAAFTKAENGRLIVAIKATEFANNGLFVDIAHESHHMGDFNEAFFLMTIGEGYDQATRRETEQGAYRVSSLMAQGSGSLNLNFQGDVLWDASWNKLDKKTLEANRSAGIEQHLASSSVKLGPNDATSNHNAYPGGGVWH